MGFHVLSASFCVKLFLFAVVESSIIRINQSESSTSSENTVLPTNTEISEEWPLITTIENSFTPSDLEDDFNDNTEAVTSQMPLVLNYNSTHEEFHLKPNRDFIDWLLGIFNGGQSQGGASNNKPPESCPACTCGVTNVGQRIVGGIITQVNQYPWMVALKYNNRFFCGGSLINSRYVLTAGHCTVGLAKERLIVVFMEHDRTDEFESKTFTRKVINIYRHRSYNSGGNYNNDIALLKLDSDVSLVGNMRPVCLPVLGMSYSGSIGKATGWGATAEYGQVSSKLREVDVPIISNDDCRKTKYGNKITANMLCAGLESGGKDACQGDSGGPLHVTNGTQNMVVGIVSWGEGCAEKDYPGVYTRVNRYLTWITTNAKDACYC